MSLSILFKNQWAITGRKANLIVPLLVQRSQSHLLFLLVCPQSKLNFTHNPNLSEKENPTAAFDFCFVRFHNFWWNKVELINSGHCMYSNRVVSRISVSF